MNLKDLDNYENQLMAAFIRHQFFEKMDAFSDKSFLNVLFQRRFLSMAFTPVYDMALDAISNEKGISVIRVLIREEYPDLQCSHRELLFSDLMAMGASRELILKSSLSKETLHSISETFSLLQFDRDLQFNEIKALSIVRFWGEVLVSEEYGQLRRKFEKLGLNQLNSQFYWPHFEHDMRKVSFSEGRSEGTHSDWLTTILREILDSSEKIEYCAYVHNECFKIKYNFWNQFN